MTKVRPLHLHPSPRQKNTTPNCRESCSTIPALPRTITHIIFGGWRYPRHGETHPHNTPTHQPIISPHMNIYNTNSTTYSDTYMPHTCASHASRAHIQIHIGHVQTTHKHTYHIHAHRPNSCSSHADRSHILHTHRQPCSHIPCMFRPYACIHGNTQPGTYIDHIPHSRGYSCWVCGLSS